MEAMVETKIKKEVSEDKLREKRAKKQGASLRAGSFRRWRGGRVLTHRTTGVAEDCEGYPQGTHGALAEYS
jgi:hypothetical protein